MATTAYLVFFALVPTVLSTVDWWEVVMGIGDVMADHYLDQDLRALDDHTLLQRWNQTLVRRFQSWSQDDMRDPLRLEEGLTSELQDITGDETIKVWDFGKYENTTQEPVPREFYNFSTFVDNFRKNRERYINVTLLAGQIGYVSIRSMSDIVDVILPDPEMTEFFLGKMAALNESKAIILDLRHNLGGDREGVVHWASFFFNATPSVPLSDVYYRDGVNQYWTLLEVPGGIRYPDKPLYLLTSNRTRNEAEEFAYAMQVVNRTTIIGETTAGVEFTGMWFPIEETDVHLLTRTNVVRNPITQDSWSGKGVTPDIMVPRAEALTEALRRLRGNEDTNMAASSGNTYPPRWTVFLVFISTGIILLTSPPKFVF
ncbi:PREDICTED: retinol-binding protein 3-like [Branchiostoma belcheri]|uniref:Retinol-binding protein 3-like n=1 Tax=Branchiostoma belcheri TaxID=7741 RepID=A0A6P4YZD1_BRABE|nr:PREDICTED: retinol-binding protein 3-like [Branchiostoma belcheri]